MNSQWLPSDIMCIDAVLMGATIAREVANFSKATIGRYCCNKHSMAMFQYVQPCLNCALSRHLSTAINDLFLKDLFVIIGGY